MRSNNLSSSPTILITGGAGFIGSAMVRYILNTTDYLVVNIDKITYAGNLASLKAVSNSPRCTFEQVDICDEGEIKRILAQYKPDMVFHLAAETHVDRSIEYPAGFIQTNIIGTFNLLEQTRVYLIENPERQNTFRFIHVSTDEVYGDLGVSSLPTDLDSSTTAQSDLQVNRDPTCHPEQSEGSTGRMCTTSKDSSPSVQNDIGVCYSEKCKAESKPHTAFNENSTYKPSSPYSASKAASDHLIQAWWRTYQLPGIVVHCSNNYGPYQYAEKLIPKTILNALNGQLIPIYGNGQQIRDWLYVEDTVEALMIIAKKGLVGQTYNVGGSSEKTNIEVVKTICQILDELVPCYSGNSITSRHPEQSEETKSASSKAESEPSTPGTVILSEGEGSLNRPGEALNDNNTPQNSSYQSLITYVKDRPGHDIRYAIDASKIQSELGWASQESFESGIRKTIKWYLDNQAWYSKCNHDY